MNKRLRKSLIEYGAIAVTLIILFVSGLHTEVFGFLQRGVLATGIMNPSVEATEEPSAANPAADFKVRLVNSKGERVNMEQFRGKVIFINLWATWCPPCIAEMPGINRLYNDVKDDVVFLMISLDDDFRKAVRFNDRKNYSFEVYAIDGPLPQMYYTKSIPTTFVINADGELVMRHEGMADYSTRKFKEFLLRQK